PHVLDEHVALLDDLEGDSSVAFLLEVKDDVALVKVSRDVEYCCAFDRRRDVMRQFAVRRFDLDHIRPQFSQELGSPRANRSDTQIKDANAVENTRHGASLL